MAWIGLTAKPSNVMAIIWQVYWLPHRIEWSIHLGAITGPHTHTHTSRKEITNESMFDLEWVSVPAEWPFICSFTTLYAVFRLSHCILFCYSQCVNASQTQTSKIYWHKQRLWLLSNIIKAEYRTVRIHKAWWMTFQYLHWMIVFTLRHPNDA